MQPLPPVARARGAPAGLLARVPPGRRRRGSSARAPHVVFRIGAQRAVPAPSQGCSRNRELENRELKRCTDQAAAEHHVDDRQLRLPAVEDRERPEREQGARDVDDAVVEDVHGDRADQADHAGCDAEQERADTGVLGHGDETAVKEDREDEGGQEDAERHREAAGEPTRHVADERREDDQRGGKDPAEGDAVEEFARRQPALGVHRCSSRNGITV